MLGHSDSQQPEATRAKSADQRCVCSPLHHNIRVLRDSGGGVRWRSRGEEWKSSPEKSRKHDLVAAAERGTSLNPCLGLTSGPGGAALSPAGIKVEQPKRSHYLILALVQEARHYIMQPG